MTERIRITREQFVQKQVEVTAVPQMLTEKLNKPLFCHLLSTYVIRPVACDENPFIILHKNKQPMFVSHKKVRQQKTADEEQQRDEEESSDEGFETVKTDKKRIKNKIPVKQPELVPVNPHFPATDPNKIVVLEKKVKAPKTERTLESQPLQEKKEAVQPEQPKKDEVLVRNKPAEKPQQKPEAPVKSEAKPVVPKKPAAPAQPSEIALAMKAALEGKPTPAPEEEKVQQQSEEVQGERPQTSRGGRQHPTRGARGARGGARGGATEGERRPHTAREAPQPVEKKPVGPNVYQEMSKEE